MILTFNNQKSIFSTEQITIFCIVDKFFKQMILNHRISFSNFYTNVTKDSAYYALLKT